jgi:hypothetical protein
MLRQTIKIFLAALASSPSVDMTDETQEIDEKFPKILRANKQSHSQDQDWDSRCQALQKPRFTRTAKKTANLKLEDEEFVDLCPKSAIFPANQRINSVLTAYFGNFAPCC